MCKVPSDFFFLKFKNENDIYHTNEFEEFHIILLGVTLSSLSIFVITLSSQYCFYIKPNEHL